MADIDITTQNETEEWRDVPGYEGLYRVSNQGRVRSLPRWGNYGRKSLTGAMTLSLINGYQCVNLKKDGRNFNTGVHRLVMLAFVGAPVAGQEVNHIDGDKANNCVENLEYCTRAENIRHAHKLGLRNAKGEQNTRAKLTDSDVRLIRQRFELENITKEALARQFGVSRTTVGRVLNGKTWKHLSMEDDS